MEEIKKRILSGEEGMYINDKICEFEKVYPYVKRAKLHLTPTILCRPRKHMAPKDWTLAIKACSGRLLGELKDLPKGSVIFAMGERAMRALLGISVVGPWRGYPLPAVKPYEFLNERGVTIFPSFSPRFVLKAPAYDFVFRLDLMNALKLHDGGLPTWIEPPIHVEEGPLMERFLARVLREKKPVGLDVETAGENPWTADLLCVGIGREDEACSVPVPTHNSAIDQMLREVLLSEEIDKSLHNSNHDLISCDAHGYPWRRPEIIRDTLIWHRIQYPLLRHDLGFAWSLEFYGPRWKSIYKKLSGGFNERLFKRIAAGHHPTILQLRAYNGQDSHRQAMLWRAAQERMAA